MKPTLNGTGFGYLDVEGTRIKHDVYILLNGEVRKRKKKLSKELYGTSHKISRAEAEHIYEQEAEGLLIGGGQFGRVHLSPEAEAFFREHGVQVEIKPTPKALQSWNEREGQWLGLFHVTC